MKKMMCAALFASLLGTAVLFAADKPPATKPATQPTTQPAAKLVMVNKFCAVEGADNKVDPDVFVIYKGQKVGFCCKDCIKDFAKDPDKYVATMK